MIVRGRRPPRLLPGRYTDRIVSLGIARLAGDNLADHVTEQVTWIVHEGVRARSHPIAVDVDVERLRHPRLTQQQLAERIVWQRVRLAAAGGAVSATPSVLPGLGTAIGLAASVADAFGMLYAQTALVLAIGSVYGRDHFDHEARAFDVLVVLALAAGLARRLPDGEIEMLGRRLGASGLTHDELVQLNRHLAHDLVQRILRRRAKIMVGRELPFGLGIAVGAGANWRTTSMVGRAAIDYFGEQPRRARSVTGTARRAISTLRR